MNLIKSIKVRFLPLINKILMKLLKIIIYFNRLITLKKDKNTLKSLLTEIIRLYRPDFTLYTYCKKYVDISNGENNSDMNTNGERRFLVHNLGRCKILFDIGANIGEWSELALNINKNLIIHCFEPSKYTFNKLIQQNFPSNVICNNFGLSSISCEKDLYIFEEGSGLNSLYQRYGLENGSNLKPQQKKEKVKLDTLQNYCKVQNISKIDYMKIDVEGHELEVLKGGSDLFKNGLVDIIQFEYGGCNIDSRILLKDFFEFFKDKDYYFYKILPNDTKLIKRYDQRLENFQYQNWLIIKKEIIFNK